MECSHNQCGLTHPLSLGLLGRQVEREKLKTHEDSVRLSAEKGRLDRSLNTVEEELAEAQRQIQLLEVSHQTFPTECLS